MNIARYTIEKKLSAWILIVLVLLGGFLSYQNLGRFEDPEFVIRQALIVTPYPGATAQEVSDEVTDVIEGALQSMQEVKEITSVSKQGMSEVTVEMQMKFAKKESDLQQIWDKMRRKISDVQNQLPREAAPSIVNDDFGDVYALFYAITGEGYTDKQLQDYVDKLRREIVLVPGVARTMTLAEKDEVIYVEISNQRLEQFGVSAEQVYQVLQNQNMITVAGSMNNGDMSVPIIPSSNIQSFDDIRNIHLQLGENGSMIRLGEIANVSRGYQEPVTMLMRYNGKRAVGLGISNISGGNVVNMGDAVKARIAELESQRPLGIELNEVSIQSDSVRASVADFVENLVLAVVIVFVVLLIFMGLRSGVIIGFGLVLTVAGTLIIMLFDGIAMQRISLGALIIALGMLVDNAIVVTDGVLERLKKEPNADKTKVVSEVVNSTIWPLLGGTIVGILAFSAIGLSPSNMGEYAGTLFWVILYSMFLSWFFAVTVTPMLCHKFIKVKTDSGKEKKGNGLKYYTKFLEWVLHHRKISVAVIIVMLISGIVGFGLVPPGFMPESERPQFVVDVRLPQGTDISRTEQIISDIEKDVMAKESVTNVSSFIGGGALRFMLIYSPESQNTSYAQLLVDVDDYSVIENLVATLQEELSDKYSDASIMAWKFVLGPGGGKKIEAAFHGPDSRVLRSLAEEAKVLMENNPKLMAVQDDWRQQIPVVRPVYSSETAQRYGLTSREINMAIEQTFSGRRVGAYREGNSLIPIVVRSPEGEREHQRALENTKVFSNTLRQFIPLSQIIDSVEVVWQDAMLRRVDRVPTIMAQADPAQGILTSEAFEDIRVEIENMELPEGYSISWHGEYKDSQEANEGLAITAPYGFAAMVLVVIFMFNGLRQAAVIWLTVPLSVLGVATGLILFQTPFEFMAILGFLSLVGMMVKNAIVLVDQTDVEIKNGMTGYQAILTATASRAKPVMLGALTTILGVAPLIADPFFKSMAVTIMFGLLFATILTLIVIPLLYAIIFRVKSE